jgi:hypothetical protein
MRERVREMKAGANGADGASEVLAKLDDGDMWPIAFALKEMTAEVEARIAALVEQAAS